MTKRTINNQYAAMPAERHDTYPAICPDTGDSMRLDRAHLLEYMRDAFNIDRAHVRELCRRSYARAIREGYRPRQ